MHTYTPIGSLFNSNSHCDMSRISIKNGYISLFFRTNNNIELERHVLRRFCFVWIIKTSTRALHKESFWKDFNIFEACAIDIASRIFIFLHENIFRI